MIYFISCFLFLMYLLFAIVEYCIVKIVVDAKKM